MSKKKPNAPALTSMAEVYEAMSELSLAHNNAQVMRARMDAELAAVRERYAASLETTEKFIKTRAALVEQWARANRDNFPEGRKSVETVFGVFGFRTDAKPTVKPRAKMTWAKVLAALKASKAWAAKYIRVKEEVNKEALINDRASLPEDDLKAIGITIRQEEEFFLELSATKATTAVREEVAA